MIAPVAAQLAPLGLPGEPPGLLPHRLEVPADARIGGGPPAAQVVPHRLPLAPRVVVEEDREARTTRRRIHLPPIQPLDLLREDPPLEPSGPAAEQFDVDDRLAPDA